MLEENIFGAFNNKLYSVERKKQKKKEQQRVVLRIIDFTNLKKIFIQIS